MYEELLGYKVAGVAPAYYSDGEDAFLMQALLPLEDTLPATEVTRATFSGMLIWQQDGRSAIGSRRTCIWRLSLCFVAEKPRIAMIDEFVTLLARFLIGCACAAAFLFHA